LMGWDTFCTSKSQSWWTITKNFCMTEPSARCRKKLCQP